MARYNAMRNYNKFRNGGVAHIRPSSAPMPMSRPNTLLGASMRNQYGNNIQGYQGGTSGAYSRYKPLIAGGLKRFKEKFALDKLIRNIEAKKSRGEAWATGGKWIGTFLSEALQKFVPALEPYGDFVLDPLLESAGTYFGGKAGYGEDVDIDTSGQWYKTAREEAGGYQEDISKQWKHLAGAQALTSLGTGAIEKFGPKFPSEKHDLTTFGSHIKANDEAKRLGLETFWFKGEEFRVVE